MSGGGEVPPERYATAQMSSIVQSKPDQRSVSHQEQSIATIAIQQSTFGQEDSR